MSDAVRLGFGSGFVIGGALNIFGGILLDNKPLLVVGLIGTLIGAVLIYWPTREQP